MEFIKLTTEKQFLNLKKGDMIIVRWTNYHMKHHPGCKRIMAYNIYQNKIEEDEIICQIKDNHYFNWRMYLENLSQAEEVYLCVERAAA